MHMTDQRDADQLSSNPERTLKSKHRFILGAIVFGALIGGLLLYTTRPREEPPNRVPPISGPEMPGIPGGMK
jgi:hypothetical protein